MNMPKRTKKILFSFLIIVASIATAIGLSRALFETRQTLDTSISMGTLHLQVGDDGPASIPLDFENMVLGETRAFVFDVENSGSIEGNFWVRGVITDTGNSLDPESEGALKDCARLSLWRMQDSGLFDNVINNMLLRNIESDFDKDAGTATDVAINSGPTEMHLIVNTIGCYSSSMGDYLDAHLEFYLTQVVED